MPGDIVRDIAARFSMDYDKSGFKSFLNDTSAGIMKARQYAESFKKLGQAQRDLNTKQLRTESQELTIANKQASLGNKALTAENQKATLANKALSAEGKKLTNQLKEVRLAQQKARGERFQEALNKQKQSAQGLAGSLRNVRDSLIAVGVVAAAGGIFKLALQTEKAVLRIKNLIDETALKGLRKRFEELNKQSDDLFSVSDFEQSAAAVFAIDRNTRRFGKSLEFAIKQAPVLGKSLREIQEGIAQAVVGGDTTILEQFGLITAEQLEAQRRRGVVFADLLIDERELFVFDRLQLNTKQLKLADEAAKGLNATWQRFTKFIDRGVRALRKDFEPVMIFVLKNATALLRLLASSPVGVLSLRIGGIIAGLAAMALGIGVVTKGIVALTKGMAILRTTTLLTSGATALLVAKFLLIGAVVLATILLLDDLWLTFAGPKDADTIFNRLSKFLQGFRQEIEKSIDGVVEALFENFLFEFIFQFNRLRNKMKKEFGNLFSFGIETQEPVRKKTISQTFGDESRSFFENLKFGLLPHLDPRRQQASEVAGFLQNFPAQPKINLGRQLIGSTSSTSNVDNSTTITIGERSTTIQSGLGKDEIVNIATSQFRREFEKELNEANIGAQ